MKSVFLILAFGIMILGTQAQDVKIKKDIVYVDNVPYLKINSDYGNEIVYNLEDKELIKLEKVTYDVPNPARNNTSDPNRYSYPATVKKRYYIVTFIDSKISFETDLTQKKLLEVIYKDRIIDDKGIVMEEKAGKFAQKTHKNISGNRPGMIIIQ